MTREVKTRKKLIEIALPLPEINDASAYDKMPGIGPHPKGIHQWWARLPLPVARAVLFASVVDDPSSSPEKFPTEDAQIAERERLFELMRRMMQKQLHKQPQVYAEARAEMAKYCNGQLPPVFDPFAGGGSIPLEASRLGFQANAGDLNPVCVLLNKCNLELVPQWIARPPVNPDDRRQMGGAENWHGTTGLGHDIRYYSRVIESRVSQAVGRLYPPIKVTPDATANQPDLKRLTGQDLPVVAWIWVRTVQSPDPSARGAHVPLVSTFWLSNKERNEVYLQPHVDRAACTWHFVVQTGSPPDRALVSSGTKIGRSQFRCILTGAPIHDEHIRTEGQAGRLGIRLVSIVADGGRGRIYLPAAAEHEECAAHVEPTWRPEGSMPDNARWFSPPLVGLTDYGDLFTSRQLVSLAALSDSVQRVRGDVLRDAISAGLSEQDSGSYAITVTTFLALALDRCTDFNNCICRWSPSNEKVMNLFGRQAIPMVWDFAEANTLGKAVGAWQTCSEYVAECVETIPSGAKTLGRAQQVDAATGANGLTELLVSTDPPYYDNIGYAALSDFFYLWLRRTIGDLYPSLFSTLLVPKIPELTASPERFGGDKHKAKEHFESGFRRAFAALRSRMSASFPLTVYYAFKQDDEESGSSERSGGKRKGRAVDLTTGWETMLEALISTGFQITATWPVRASQKWRMVSMGTNALASYIVLACRPRPEDAPHTDRRSFIAELKRDLPTALKRLQQGNIAPVDFAQAAIGPGMAIYSRYSHIVEASGQLLSVRSALALINQTLTEVLSEQEDEFDNETRWAIAWFEQHGFETADFGEAELLSKAKVTSVEALRRRGIVAGGAGKVQLLVPSKLAPDWDPERDSRAAGWEVVHQLIRVLESQGEAGAASVVSKLGSKSELARDLAYRLYSICERKKRAQEALSYNALVQSWPEILRLARERGTTQASPKQTEMYV